jgi:hypothetical protein
MGKKNQDPDPGCGSGMNIPDHISESLETKFFDADPDPESFDPGSGMRDGKKSDPGSGINIPDLQHCIFSFPFYALHDSCCVCRP